MTLPKGWQLLDEQPTGLPAGWELVEEKDPKKPGLLGDTARRIARSQGVLGGQALAGLGTFGDIQRELQNRGQNAIQQAVFGVESPSLKAAQQAERDQAPLSWTNQATAQLGDFISQAANEAYNVDKSRDDTILAKLADSSGSLSVPLATGPLAPVAYAAMMAKQGYDEAVQKLQAAGETDPDKIRGAAINAALLNAGLGAVSEKLLGVPAMFKSIANMGGKTTVGRVANQAAKGFVREGTQEGIEQIGQNVIAKDIVGYDPQRNRTEGVGEAALLGGLMGAPTSAAFQGAQEYDARKGHQAYAAYLDTEKNVPEAKKTLLLQQDQLLRGLRPAQMFPKGSPELPLPDGLERVETERGVFHFNPEQTSADNIIVLSKLGRENEILNLGPYSKPEVEALAKQTGQPIITTEERAQDGTEIRAAIGTPSTAPEQAAAMEATKSPGSTITTGTPAMTTLERLRAADAALEAEVKAAQEKEQKARAERQADLAAKKARFDETLVAARSLAANPQADYGAINGAVASLTQYAEDNSLGLTLEQRQEALAELARLQPRLNTLRPAFEAQKTAAEEELKRQAKLDEAAKMAKIRAENARIDAIEATGRDPDTRKIVQLENVPDEELNALDLQAEGISEDAYAQELQRRERAAAEENTAGYSLRDLFIGRKDKLAAAGLKAPLRLPTPEIERQRGGLGGELAVLQEGGVPWQYFKADAKGLDTLAETLRGLGFQAETESDALALVERAFSGQDVKPQGVEFATGRSTPLPNEQDFINLLQPVLPKIRPEELRKSFRDFIRMDGRQAFSFAEQFSGYPNSREIFTTLGRIWSANNGPRPLSTQPTAPAPRSYDYQIRYVPAANLDGEAEGYYLFSNGDQMMFVGVEPDEARKNAADGIRDVMDDMDKHPAIEDILDPEIDESANPERQPRPKFPSVVTSAQARAIIQRALTEEQRAPASEQAADQMMTRLLSMSGRMANDMMEALVRQPDRETLRDWWRQNAPNDAGPLGGIAPEAEAIYAQREAEARKAAERERQAKDKPKRDLRLKLARWFKRIAKQDAAWQLGRAKTKSKDFQEIAKEYSTPGNELRVTPPGQYGNEWRIAILKNGVETGHLTAEVDSKKEVYVGATQAKSNKGKEGGGKQAYQAIFTWAHNNGYQVRGSSLTDINQIRRTVNMLSSALRHDTTDHLIPYSTQGLNSTWKDGDTDNNIGTMLVALSEEVAERVPRLDRLTYDPRSDKIIDVTNGNALGKDDIAGLLQGPAFRDAGIGDATLRLILSARSQLAANAGRNRLDPALSAKGTLRGANERMFYATAAGRAGERNGRGIDARPATEPAGNLPADRSDDEVARQLKTLRQALGPIAQQYDIQVGLVADLLEAEGYRREAAAIRRGDFKAIQAATAPRIQEQIDELRNQRRFIVVASEAVREGNLTGLTLHELAHPFFELLPQETKAALRKLHAYETSAKTGPLYQDGELATNIAITADELPADRVAADPDLPVKEWFAERIRAQNEAWLAGRMKLAEAPTFVRVWRQFMDRLRQIFAQIRGVAQDADIFTDTFRQWIQTGQQGFIAEQGAAYAQQMMLGDLVGMKPADRATAQWSAAFDAAMEEYYQEARDSVSTNPPERVSAEEQARRDGEVLTPAAAKQRVEQWKAAARAQGKNSANADKIILSLFDSSGVWSQPWRDAGYTVVQIDQKIVGGDGYEMDIMDVDQEWLMDNGLDMVHGILAACPCTEFAGSGARWFKIKDADGRTEKARQLVHHTLAIIEYLQPDGFWAIENPVGRIKQETQIPTEQLQFQPHNYGDPYTKRTQIFGMFNPNLPQANVDPTGGSYSWNLSGTSDQAKELRSKTFEGFAYAFFMANKDRNAYNEAETTADRKVSGVEFAQQAEMLPGSQGGQSNVTRDFRPDEIPAGENPPSKGDLDDLKLYAFPGNKSEINSKIYGLIQRAVQTADHVADLTFGAGVHFQTARRADTAGQVKAWTVNEWSPLRVNVVRQLGQNAPAVLDQAGAFYAEILAARKAARTALGKKAKGNHGQRAESRAVQAWMNRTVWDYVLPAGFDIDAWVEKNGTSANLPIQDTPAAAAWALVAQEYKGGLDSVELTVVAKDATQEMNLGDNQRENYRPRGGRAYRLGDILTQISDPTVSRSNAQGDGIDTAARDRLLKVAAGYQGATVTQGDAWEKLVPLAEQAKAQGQRLLVFLDPPYWKNTDLKGGTSNYSEAVSAGASLSGLRRRVAILKQAHDLGARVLFTNDWHPLLAKDLRKAGYYVISENRANDATKPEVIAFNWNPQNGNQETRPEAQPIYLPDGRTSGELQQGLQDPADGSGNPDNRGRRPAAQSDSARPGEENRADRRVEQPAERIAQIDTRLAELQAGTDQDPQAVEEEGQRLTAERARLIAEMHEAEQRAIADANLKTATELQAEASEAAKLTRHPAAQGTVQPGEAWAPVATLTPFQIQKEREKIAEHINDNYHDLADIERRNLTARVDALKAEEQRRQDPIAAAPRVTPIQPTDRKSALLAELQRGRKLRDDGMKTGAEDAEQEGLRIVRLATERLNDEFPGWDQQDVSNQTKGRIENAPASQPVPATQAQRAEDDGRNLPPPPPIEPPENGPAFQDEPAPNRGRAKQLYGHSAHQPTWLERSWEKAKKALVGIRGPVPELPTFPAAKWNKVDRFIQEKGPEFYNGLKEFWRTLRSGNDYVQRTAEEQVGAIVEPLLKIGGKFSADDYRRMQRLQEKVRVAQAEKKPVSPRLLANLAGLQSRMESHPYVLFNRMVLLLDLDWRYRNLKDSQGNPIKMPLGLNGTEIQEELKRIDALIAASPHKAAIDTAIDRHREITKQIYEDLKFRDLFAAQHLSNTSYFPHLTLEITQGDKVKQRELQPERVRPGTEADFRGYLIDPIGSTKPIETDYVRAMYYHLVQVGAHNFKADAIRNHARPYDIMAQVQARAKELAKQRGVPVSWEQAYNEEYAPRGYVLYGTDSRDAFPTLQIDREKLARRLGIELTSEDIHQQLATLGLRNVKLLPEDLTETLQMGQRETWIVPSRVAEALRGIADRQAELEVKRGNPMATALGYWKAWKLFTPQNHIRYEFNNIIADAEKILSATPRTLMKMPQAAKEIRAFYQGAKPGDDLRAALKDGVINAITAQEMSQLQRMRAFEKFQTLAQRLQRAAVARASSAIFQPITIPAGLSDLSSVELSAFRESVTRYANYLANLEAIRNGARPAYAGAYWRDIEAIQDSKPGAGDRAQRQAAQISKATFGDYGDLSVNGEWLRRNLVPFYSWMEVNFKYHANLLRNLRDMVSRKEISRGKATGQAAAAIGAAAAGLGTRAAAGIALRLALPYAAVALWNTIGGPMAGAWDDDDDLEKELSEEDRRRFHIILGRTADGKVSVVYGATALADVMKWFAGPKFMQSMGNWLQGRSDFTTALTDWSSQIAPDLLNIAAGSLGPVPKIAVAATLRKNTFPDVTDAKTIPAYDLRRTVLSQMTDDLTADMIERLANKDYVAPKDLGTWATQLILQVRRRDPEAWAFYAIKDKAAEFQYRQTGERSGYADRDAPDQQVLRNFRRAIFKGDAQTASAMYLRLLDLGYTAERFSASIRAQDPLSSLSKKDGLRQQFVASLDATDRQLLERAYRYYAKLTSNRGQEAQLFPKDSWGQAGQQAYQAQPRTELLRRIMELQAQQPELQIQRRGAYEQWRSLQRN